MNALLDKLEATRAAMAQLPSALGKADAAHGAKSVDFAAMLKSRLAARVDGAPVAGDGARRPIPKSAIRR